MFLFLSHLHCQNFTDQQKDVGWTDNKVTGCSRQEMQAQKCDYPNQEGTHLVCTY